MRRGQRKGMSPVAAGLLTLAVLCVVVYFGFTKSIPFQHHYTVSAVFGSANNIRPGSPVRMAGVNVGKVTGVGHVEDGKQAAVVTMRIDKKGLPIHRDATFKIRPRIFLEGNFFVDVSPARRPRPPWATAIACRSTRPARRCSSTRSSARCRRPPARTCSRCCASCPRA